MQLVSKVHPPYFPEIHQTSVLRLGIAPLASADWLQPDADFDTFHSHKLKVITESCHKVCLSLPDAQQAQQQFTSFLLQQLRKHHAADYTQEKYALAHLPTGQRWDLGDTSLHASSRWIQEDICLLEPSGNDFIMTAASVCSPSNWKLEDKIGRTLDAIHTPVPGYQAQLAARVNRLLAGLKPGKSLLRFNWSLQRGNELLWRPDAGAVAMQDDVYWRVERQSLLRIPDTAIVIFSIRIYLHALATLVTLPGFQKNLQGILDRLPADQKNYKGLQDMLLR